MPLELTEDDLKQVFRIKFGDLTDKGWGPRIRHRYQYYSPDEYYEAMVAKLVKKGSAWLEVGGGRFIFPSNAPLARLLADRCGLLVVADPDSNVEQHSLAHQTVRCRIEDYGSAHTFDVVTLRMVAEHIAEPKRAIQAIATLTKPGSHVVVYTINRRSPVPFITWLAPFVLHHPIKRLVWGGESRDTFPVQYRMNTRKTLATLFRDAGFVEHYFAYLDDCRTSIGFRAAHLLELNVWRLFRSCHVRYPENCLLGVYTRV